MDGAIVAPTKMKIYKLTSVIISLKHYFNFPRNNYDNYYFNSTHFSCWCIFLPYNVYFTNYGIRNTQGILFDGHGTLW